MQTIGTKIALFFFLLSSVVSRAQSVTQIINGGTGAKTAAGALSNVAGNPAAGTYSILCADGTHCATTPVSSGGGSIIPANSTCAVAGDSISAGYGLSPPSLNWFNQLMLLPQAANCVSVQTGGAVSGATVESLQVAYASVIHPHSPAVTGNPGTLFVQIGTNNIQNEGESAATIYALLQTYWATAAADGWAIVMATVNDRGIDNCGFCTTVSQYQQLLLLNSLIRGSVNSGSNYPSVILDFYSWLDRPQSTVLFQDQLHPTAAGAQVLAQNSASVLSARGGIQDPSSPYDTIWTPTSYEVTPTSNLAISLAIGTDLNTILTTGIYDVDAPVNGPTTGGNWYQLFVYAGSATPSFGPYAVQIAFQEYPYGTNIFFQRTCGNSTCGKWAQTYPQASVFLPASTDLNTVNTPCGIYDGQNLVNSPFGTNWTGVQTLCSDGTSLGSNYWTQLAWNALSLTPELDIRTAYGSTPTAWVPVLPFSGGIGGSYQDVTESAAPSNPASGTDRLYTDSTTHLLTCLTSSGGSCMPSNLTGTTGTITGTSLTATCDSGTASVPGAVVGHPVAVSSTTGVDVGGAFDLRASVTSTGTVTVYVCGTGTPANLAYNVVVF